MRWDRANFVFVKEHQNQTKLREALLTVLLSGICQQGKIMMIFWKFLGNSDTVLPSSATLLVFSAIVVPRPLLFMATLELRME